MTHNDLPNDIPALTAVLVGADHVDVKTAEVALGDGSAAPSLRNVVAGALGYRPGWLVALFAARVVFAVLLRLERAVPKSAARRLRADEIDFTPGAAVGFFTVAAGQEDRFLLLQASDTHLTGYLAFVVDPAEGGRRRFRAVTVVRYHRWTGPVYFGVVRPFHHLVVAGMVRAAARFASENAAAPGSRPRKTVKCAQIPKLARPGIRPRIGTDRRPTWPGSRSRRPD